VSAPTAGSRVVAGLALGLVLGVAAAGPAAARTAVVSAARAASAGKSPAVRRPAFIRAFSGSGSFALTQPFGVAVDARGDVWVADRGSDRIAEFSPAGRLIIVLAPAGAGALAGPEGIALAGAGRLWVADTGHDRAVELSRTGHVLAVAGGPRAGRGHLSSPVAVAVAQSGDIYVADQGDSRIAEFSASGSYLRSIAVATPAGVAVSPAGDLWVSSPSYVAGNTVTEFSPAGTLLQSFGTTQASFGGLSNPSGIAMGPSGQILVAQPDYGWVTVYQQDGGYLTEFGPGSGPGGAGQGLAFPQGLAVTAGGDVWVADSGNGRVAEFTLPALAPPGTGRPWLPWLLLAVLLAALLGLTALLLRRERRRASGAAAPAGASRSPGTDGPSRQLAVSRRALLTGATALTGAAYGAGVLPVSLRRALAASLASPPRARLSDIEHIVILMQENRSFDHYFGAMPGVRGFADPAAIRLPGGRPVFCQPVSHHPQGYLLPFHFDTKTTSSQATPGTDHLWPSQHQAWNGGKMDSWIAAKGEYTMGYFGRADIPFHWALAEAFTICDNYYCSVLGPTNPNRLYMWTGMIDPAGTGGGPVIDDTPAFNNVILSWTTYPERLQRAGISWQVYQEEDNFDDNALAWFTQYAHLPASSPLYQRGIAARPAGTFEQDARYDRLPQVSWLIAPTAQSEHPDYFPAAGAEYIAQKLDAIASNQVLWAKTAFILSYDENDGLFDHVPPPIPPAGTAAEFVAGLPIGLGFRVPAIVVSPWTAGGYVNSDVFDHTSLIRLIEARFGVREPNISSWRRRTCGDLTSVFRFSAPPTRYPQASASLRVAATEAWLVSAQQEVSRNPAPVIPQVNQPLPRQ